jgi:DNA polymerase-3 subunit epsilon
MSWFTRLFRPHVELPPGFANRVATWKNLPGVSENVPLRQARCVVVDVETTGLDTRRDRLLSIGACVVEALRVRTGEGFEAIQRHHQASELNNIPIHGSSTQSRAVGEAPPTALMEFSEFLGKYPLATFHASLDRPW